MGALTESLAGIAWAAGAELRLGVEVTVDRDRRRGRRGALRGRLGDRAARAGQRRARGAGAAARRAGARRPAPEGAQLKLNMLLKRLPKLRDTSIDPREAFAGTFHVNESATQLAVAYAQAQRGPRARARAVRDLLPLADRSVDPRRRAARRGRADADVLRAAHADAAVRRRRPRAAKAEAIESTLRSLNSVLGEPIEDCLWITPSGEPCLEARTPVELEAELGLPGGNIFHRDLAWPFAEERLRSARGAWRRNGPTC